MIGTPALPTLIWPGSPSAAINAAKTAAWVRSEIEIDSHRLLGVMLTGAILGPKKGTLAVRSSDVLMVTRSIPRRHEGTLRTPARRSVVAVTQGAATVTHRMER